jgi:hypothetical protein
MIGMGEEASTIVRAVAADFDGRSVEMQCFILGPVSPECEKSTDMQS